MFVSNGDEGEEGHFSWGSGTYKELTEYEGIDSEALNNYLCVCKKELNNGWNREGQTDPDGFYRGEQSRWYLYDLTLFNINLKDRQDVFKLLLDFFAKCHIKSVLDFGSGIGSMGIFFAKNNMDVGLIS